MDRFEQKKQRLVEVAEKSFSRYGFEKSSMKSIAEDAGIGKASLYYYFPSKEELFLEVLNKELQEYRLNLHSLQEKSIDILEKLRNFLELPIVIYEKYGHTLMRLILKVASTGLPSVDSQFESLWNSNKQIFTDLLHEGINKKLLRKDIDVSFLSDIYLMILSKGLFIDGEKKGIKIITRDRIGNYKKMVDILFNGILEKQI